MYESIISIAHFAENEDIKKTVLKSDEIRRKTLDHCYSLPGYESLPLTEKNKVYRKVMELYTKWKHDFIHNYTFKNRV